MKNTSTANFVLKLIATVVVLGIVLAIIITAGPAILMGIQNWFDHTSGTRIATVFALLILGVLIKGLFPKRRR